MGFNASPTKDSFSPFWYRSAVSKKLNPLSAAFCSSSVFVFWFSRNDMQPNPTGLTYKSDLPNWFMYGFSCFGLIRIRFLYCNQFNFKHQRTERRNIRWGALFTVGQ